MIIPFHSPYVNPTYIERMMAVAREHMKVGKKVLFAYSDIRNGILTLSKYFPNALYEVKDGGLVVWERKRGK